MKTDISTPAPGGEVIVYESREGEARVDVRLDQETVWLTQRQMAEVFHTSTDNVSLHLKNIYATGELGEAATTEGFSVVRSEGQRKVRRGTEHYTNWMRSTLSSPISRRRAKPRHSSVTDAASIKALLLRRTSNCHCRWPT